MALPFPPGVKDFVKTEHHDTYPAIFPQRANLKGRSVLITGASRGIGRALAISYGIAGASHIAITARNHIPEIVQEVKAAAVSYERAEPQVVSIKLDVTSKESVDACRKKVEEAFGGKLDIVVANHGMLAAFVPIPESDPDIWWQQYEVNVKGTYLVARAFIPLLQKAGSLGNFVVQSSVGAHLSTPGGTAYQSGKLALARMTEAITIESRIAVKQGKAETAVCAYAVHPGAVKTDLASSLPDFVRAGLIDSPELAADAIVWLTREQREWLTGRYFSVNWDVDELVARKEEVVEKNLLKMRMTH